MTTIDLLSQNESTDGSTVETAVQARMNTLGETRHAALAAVFGILGRAMKATSDIVDVLADEADEDGAEDKANDYRDLVGAIDEALDRVDTVMDALAPGEDA